MKKLEGFTARIIGIRTEPTVWASKSYILCVDKGYWKWTDEMLEG